jgi:hypothetical protein
MKLQNVVKNTALSSLVGLMSLSTPTKSDAAIIALSNPVELGNNIDIEVAATNDDQGAIYNSGTHLAFQQLFSDLYALPVNSDSNHPNWTGYNSLEDFIAGANIGISPSAPSNVSDGWNVVKNNDGSIDVNNIGGFINRDYDGWFDNVTQPNQSTQSVVYTIPRDKLAIGFDENNQPIQWASIVLSGQTQPNMFTGFSQNMLDSWSADGHFYQVAVPEPSTYAAILGGTALGLGLLRRRQKNQIAKTNSIDKIVDEN